MKSVAIVSLAVMIAACSTQQSARQSNAAEQIGQAVTVPLNDLNLVHTAIPKILQDAQKKPYAAPPDLSCAALASDIRELDEVLGADLDTPATEKNPSLVVRGVNAIGDESLSAIKKTTESVVPFRNWVRKLSGAERSSKAVASAIAAGSIRRAYLKGIGLAKACPTSARPQVSER